ncbi:MAG TPA: potassium-transporting ATPase subunit KdpB [Pirellulaceae bacterium]|nr:potassium-transporting ATPase subunit KdpB [Pirellulaceae bacterium]
MPKPFPNQQPIQRESTAGPLVSPSLRKKQSLFTAQMLIPSMGQAVKMLDPRIMVRNPVMFVTELGAALTTLVTISAAISGSQEILYFLAVSIWLWLTVWFANFAEAVAEARGKAQADALKATRQNVTAKKMLEKIPNLSLRPDFHDLVKNGEATFVPAPDLRMEDIVLVEAGDQIPGDGEVIGGVASVDESAITGESAPVIRESGGDRSSVTGGTRVLSDWIFVRITANPGESFLDRMIHLVEGAKRQKTPNEVALTIVLAGFTIVFLLVCSTLYPIARYFDVTIDVPTLAALLVCLIPTTIGALLAAIGIAGMARMIQANVIATSGRAVEAAGDVNVLLLDKTGTITLGNRQAVEFLPAEGITTERLADAAQLASLADETPEGRSIVVLAKEKYGLRGRDLQQLRATFVPFTAQTRMSGVNLDGRRIRKGALEAVAQHLGREVADLPDKVIRDSNKIAQHGGTPLVVAEGEKALGVIHLKDIVKGGIKERFAELRQMGIKTVMITGDNPLTAAAIAAEAGVDDFLAQATPEAKLKLIRQYQGEGHLIAMTGDGTNDAPALAQADVAVAMNSGTQAAKEAGNMVDLDSNPTKLIDVVTVGKQMLMTRGALTTFSIANDVAKYFAIIPAIFMAALPSLAVLNIMHLATPKSAILSAVIFNALVIPCLIPIAIRGVQYRPASADSLLQRNLLIYGLGGLVVPFIGIKLIDLALFYTGLAG